MIYIDKAVDQDKRRIASHALLLKGGIHIEGSAWEADVFMFFDITSSFLLWFCHALTQCPKIVKELQNEIYWNNAVMYKMS